ncbi:MAG: ABC transporter ATP-binding protein [Nocardioidaceae bacterium]|nr:ABC transporter ATP-binding protein [Nocardioidaceae bacterium]
MSRGLAVTVDLPRLRAEVRVRPGSTVAVVGPNGAGKTTLVEAAAGTAPGRTSYDGEDWSGLPPYRRSVGMVFQEHLLFPHLDARDNVAFGLQARGVRRHGARRTAERWLSRIGLPDVARQRPAALSGGQAQRVALARALATQPRVLLLDEPFAALDVAAGAQLRLLLAAHLRDFEGVTLLVTHDAIDARALADEVVVLEHGTVAQVGTPAEIAEAPATAHAARLLGLNVLAAEEVVVPGHAPPGTLVTFAPSAVTLTVDEPAGSARNRWQGVVHTAVERDGIVRVHLRGAHDLYADVTPAAVDDLGLEPGRAAWASVKATEVTVLADGPT